MTERARFGVLTIAVVVGAILAITLGQPRDTHDGHAMLLTPGVEARSAAPSIGPASGSSTGPATGPTEPGRDAQASPVASPGSSSIAPIMFGKGLDVAGNIVMPTSRFGPGPLAFWSANLARPASNPNVFFMIIQVLPDGREFEHWRQEVTLADPNRRRIVGSADLFVFAHNGAGHYRMRYVDGEAILAEGAFDLE